MGRRGYVPSRRLGKNLEGQSRGPGLLLTLGPVFRVTPDCAIHPSQSEPPQTERATPVPRTGHPGCASHPSPENRGGTPQTRPLGGPRKG